MAGVIAEVELEIDPALSAIGAIDQAFAEVVSTFQVGVQDALDTLAGQSATVDVQADPSAAEGEVDAFIAGTEALDPTVNVLADASEAMATADDFAATADALDPTVQITADDSQAQAALDSLAALADATDPTVTISVDDSEVLAAQDSLDGLDQSLAGAGDGAQQASSGFKAAAGEGAGLGIVTQGLKGDITGAGTAMLGMSDATAAAAGPVGAIVAGLGVLFVAGEKMSAGIERMTLVFGEFAKEAETINIGGLAGQMSDLAIQVGSSPAVLRQATAALGQTVISMGQTKEEAAGVSTQFEALALRAVAMNPKLGEAGDVVVGLQRGLAMGGRFAAKFNLGMLNAAEIAARASIMFHKPTAELTVMEKAMAGAQIATEKLGRHMGTDFQKGSEQSAVQFKSLIATFKGLIAQIGQPLIAPAVDITKALGPLLKLGVAINSILPFTVLLQVGFKALGAVAEAIAPFINKISDAVQVAVKWIGDLVDVVIEFVGGQIGDAVGVIADGFVNLGESIAQAFNDIVDVVSTVADVIGAVFSGIGDTVIPIFEDIAGTISDVFNAVIDIIGGVGGFIVDAFKDAPGAIKLMIAPIEFVIGIVGDLIGALDDLKNFFVGSSDTTVASMNQIKTASDGALVHMAALFSTGIKNGILSQKDALKTLKDALDSDQASGLKFGAALVSAGVITRGQYVDALAAGEASQQKHKKAVDATTLSFDEQQKKEQEAADAAKKAAQEITDAVNKYVDSVVAKIPDANAAWDDATKNVAAFGIAAEDPINIDALNNNLFTAIQQVEQFPAKLNQLTAEGFTAVEKFIEQQGPVLGSKTFAAFEAATPEAKAAMEALLTQQGISYDNLKGDLETRERDRITAGTASAFSGVPDAATPVLDALTGKFGQLPDLLRPPGFKGGTAVGEGITAAKPGVEKAAGESAAGAAAEGTRHTGKFHDAGVALAGGLAKGLDESHTVVATAGGALVVAAAGATRGTGLFVEAGAAGAGGYADGIFNSLNLAQDSGTALINAAAGATRNTGLFAQAGEAGVGGYADGIFNRLNLAGDAGRAVVVAAAGGTRNTGLFYDAGYAAANGYAQGIYGGTNLAVNAAITMAVRAVNAAKNAGSPTVHLWADMARSHAAAYSEALAGALQKPVKSSLLTDKFKLSVAPRVGVAGGSSATTNNAVTLIRVDSFDEALALLPAGVRASAAHLSR